MHRRDTGIEYATNRSVCVEQNGGIAHTQSKCAHQHCHSQFQYHNFRSEKYGGDCSNVRKYAYDFPRAHIFFTLMIFIRSGFGPDPRTSKFEIKSRVPVLTSQSNYKSTMNLFALPIRTEGVSNTTLSKCHYETVNQSI